MTAASSSSHREWSRLLGRYPSIAEQFAEARIADPPGRLLETGRLQRLAARMAGPNWVLLPHTAGFIDPLHSTGMAHTLCGIERLVNIFQQHWDKPSLPEHLGHYEQTLRREFALIDRLVSGCYRARRNHRLFTAFSMLYFAAATTYEHRRSSRTLPRQAAFLCADDDGFQRLVHDLWQRVETVGPSDVQIARFEQQVCDAIRPYNRVGLCDPAARNMYRYTAATREASRMR